MLKARLITRSYALTALAVVVALMSAMSPGRASAQSADSYESETFGFSIEWDEDVWTGTVDMVEENAEAIKFESVSSFGTIQAAYMDVQDAEACLADIADSFADDDGDEIENFGVAPVRMERPESLPGAEAELYVYTFVDGGAELDQAMYLSCLPILDGQATLEVVLMTTPDSYDDVWTEWDDLVGGITVDEPSDDRTSSRDREDDDPGDERAESSVELTNDSYVDEDYRLSLNWDEDTWTAEEFTSDEGSLGVILLSDVSNIYIIVNAQTFDTTDDCLDNVNDTFESDDVVEDFDIAPRRLERPESVEDASGDLYAYWDADEEVDMVIYNECRLVEGDHALSLQFLTLAEEYKSELPLWQEVLDNVEVDAPAVDQEQTSEDEPVRTGTTKLTTPNHGLVIRYDRDFWAADDISEANLDDITFDSTSGNAEVMVIEDDADLAACMNAIYLLESERAIDGALDSAPRRVDRPVTAPGAVGDLFEYEVDGEDGPVTAYSYLECREFNDGEAVVLFSFRTLPDLYPDALPELEKLLAGIAS